MPSSPKQNCKHEKIVIIAALVHLFFLLYSTLRMSVATAQQLKLEEDEKDAAVCNITAGCCACSSSSTTEEKPTEENANNNNNVMNNNNDIEATSIRILSVGAPGHATIVKMVRDDATAFMNEMNGRVNIIVEEIGSLSEIANEIRVNAALTDGFYDGFVSNPGVVGTAVATHPPGFMDLGDFVRESSDLNWLDILPAFREVITTYDGKVYMLPLDGDVHSLFYRIDILDHFGLNVPRTWDEYVNVAKVTHGKLYNGTTLNGSCIGRTLNCVGAYYANLVLAPITQTMGTTTGYLFDPRDMTPLAGEALAEAIRQLELQAEYGADDEFEDCGGGGQDANNIKHFLTEGNCVMTYNWGDNYKKSLSETSKVGGLVGVAPTPGSSRVLDRETGKLVPCDEERCKLGTYYEDIGWVNKASYAAFGGWAAAVAGNVSPMRQRIAADFFAYASGMRSNLGVIPNATAPLSEMNGQDPYRQSHFDVDEWVAQGFPREGTETYKNTILESLSSKNLAVDIRFPESDRIYGALDKNIYDYLQRVKNGEIAEADRAKARLAVADATAREWTTIIEKFDKERPPGDQSILVQYQRSLGIYKPAQDYNYIGSMRYFGWTLASLVVLCSILMAAWVAKNRTARIVKASQPIFLIIICVGCLLMGAGMYPLSIDSEIASFEGCNIACMVAPWLLGTGFSCAFSALFSKTLRVNKLFSAASNFQRVTVTVKDVMKPFIVLLSLNVILLGIWTGVNPMVYRRVRTSPTSSYGVCQPQNSSGAGLTPVILFGLLNFSTLVAANVQAFRAREISDEFSESKYIAIALLSILQAMLIGVPVAFMTRQQPPVYAVIMSCFVFIVAMSLLLLMFLPKIILARKKANERIAKRQQKNYRSSTLSSASETEGIRIIRGPTKRFSSAEAEETKKNDEATEQQDKEKLRELKLKLTEQGIDASALFNEVGLDVSEESDGQQNGEE